MGDPAGAVTGVGISVDHTADSLAELGGALDRLAALGVDSAEIFLPAMGVVLGGRVQRDRMRQMARICAGRPIGLTFHGPLSADLGDCENGEIQQAAARAGIEAAAECGGTVYVQHQTISPSPDRQVVERRLGCEREALAALAPEARASGVVIGVECMFCNPGEWTALPHELAAQLSAVGHPAVAAVIDFSHAALNAAARGAALRPSLATLAPHARHLHVHDSFARPPAFRPWTRGDAMSFGFGDLHLPPGDGALDWDGFADLPYGGRGVIANLELDRRWMLDWPGAIEWTRRWVERVGARRAAAAAG